ncbi:MAG: minor capsid protein [Candidatus Sabulitectum sp.]|nr:minor capsid protein [Candidatus Sabulitectum sp.]
MDPGKQLPLVGEITANEAWMDALIRHQIYLLRFSGSIRNEITGLLNATEKDIAQKIRGMLTGDTKNVNKRLVQANALLKDIKAIRNSAWDDVDAVWLSDFEQMVVKEAVFLKTTLDTVVPVVLNSKLPPAAKLKALIKTQPFEGRVLKEWAASVRASDLRKIEDQIKIGIVQGESNAAIARRVIGTAKLKGRDGITQLTRRNVETITRTATISFSNAARGEFLQANAALFEKEVYVATLDSRTTAICRSLDGDRFPVGEGPQPPLHFNCRSLRVALIGEDMIGTRPYKPVTKEMLLRRYCKQNNIKVVSSRARLPRGHKMSYDQFARVTTRAMIGQVPAKVTYGQWLGRQSVEFQNDVLGPTRGKLFRKGELSLDKFVNRQGDELTLAELADKEAAAFRAAGLDPKEF